jgi:hypothetical protein
MKVIVVVLIIIAVFSVILSLSCLKMSGHYSRLEEQNEKINELRKKNEIH